jgi:hypothetical protein
MEVSTLLAVEFEGGFWIFGKFGNPYVTFLWDMMTYPDA